MGEKNKEPCIGKITQDYDPWKVVEICGGRPRGNWQKLYDKRVWEQAWVGRRKSWHAKVPGQEVLCIGCLEQRLGRTLIRRDFPRSANQ